MEELNYLTLKKAQEGLRQKKFSAVELAEACFERAEAVEDKVQAYITRLSKEEVVKQAQKVDEKIAAGKELKSLEGIPMSFKDLFCTAGVQTTAGSKILEGFVPPYDATAVKRLKGEGVVITGKNTQDEFGHGASSENTGFAVPRNPWDLERVAGGSSGGSVAAVASGQVIFSLGTDTGGSVRQPASMCSVTGLKPTYGRISRFGVISMASSLDTVGMVGRSAEDIAQILQTLAGHDYYDSTTPEVSVPDYLAHLDGQIKGMKIGIPKEYFVEGIEKGVLEVVQQGIKELEKMGAEVKEVSLLHTKYAIAAYYIICPSEVSANMARYDGIRFGPTAKEADELLDHYLEVRSAGFHPEVKRRIMIGTYALSAGYYEAYYLKAMKVRTLVKQDFEKAFEEVDVLATPVSPFPAFKIGAKVEDPLSMYLCDVFTVPPSLAGICGLSVPAGFTEGLPVGMQILGPQFKEEVVLKVGDAFQRATDWHEKVPS